MSDTIELTVRSIIPITVPSLDGIVFIPGTNKLNLLSMYTFTKIYDARHEIHQQIDLGNLLVTFNKIPIVAINDWSIVAGRLAGAYEKPIQSYRLTSYDIDTYSVDQDSTSQRYTVKPLSNNPKGPNPFIYEDIKDSHKDSKETIETSPANVPRTISKRPDLFSNRIDQDIDTSFE
jgi:hypothetical protein